MINPWPGNARIATISIKNSGIIAMGVINQNLSAVLPVLAMKSAQAGHRFR